MRIALPLLLIVSLAGCAAVTPGYSPDTPAPDQAAKGPSMLKPFNGGSMVAGDRYAVSTEERALSCSKITGSMHVMMSRLRDSANRPKPGAATTAMQATAKPFIGAGANLDVSDEIKQTRARLKAYNDLLAEKKCKTLDIANA